MNVGTICYATNQGIAYLARDFYHERLINRVYEYRHPHYPTDSTRYPQAFRIGREKEFLDGLDALFLFETYLNSSLIHEAHSRGIKIILMPMYEYTPHPFPVPVDLCICPSLLDLQVYKNIYNCLHIPVPVRKIWKRRTIATRFIHNAGHGQYKYAKGTPELLEAMKFVKSDATLLVRAQPCNKMDQLFKQYKNTRKTVFILEDIPEELLFNEGDVFIYPEKYNGLSLPLQEAYASGMLVMTTNRFPANSWLPIEPLLKTRGSYTESIRGGSGFSVEWSIINPEDIAKAIDHWYGKEINNYSCEGLKWSMDHSWSTLLPKYKQAISSLF